MIKVMRYHLDPQGGFAGNICQALLAGIGGDLGILLTLPERLNVPGELVIDLIDDAGRDGIFLDWHKTETQPPQRASALINRVTSAKLPASVTELACEGLGRQFRRYLETGLANKNGEFEGKIAADTLLDICGSLLLWHTLGAPQIIVDGPLPWTEWDRLSPDLLGDLPSLSVRGRQDLLTPTGAVILSLIGWAGEERTYHSPPVAIAGGEFAREGKIPPSRLYSDLELDASC
jgi:hypothetical protein